ncbi:MAG TPA: 3-oxoacyl-[acyl-carrier-protein] reductase [Syntrophomonadaceae bacterium]|nr:3-oxoacyl-[acyl-carrier-protein] reductase [Syntrophomonadaceae bacterium]
MHLNDQVALVTGSSRGIGRATVLQLARDGFRVVVNYYSSPDAPPEVVAINEKEARQVLEEITAVGGQGAILGADVSDAKAAQSLVDEAARIWSRLDVLVNNAGIIKDQLLIRISDQEWDNVIRTNLNSAFYCSRAALKHMVKKRTGRIVNISSVVGLSGNVGQAHYAASKSGLLGFSRTIAKEYGSRGITCNVVAPGYIASDMTAQMNPDRTARILEGISLGRLGTPEDVANVVAFLVSPGSAYISGQIIQVDGGMAGI